MQSIYTNPKPMVYEKRDEKKEEISKTIKKMMI